LRRIMGPIDHERNTVDKTGGNQSFTTISD
jgi:hypothetical protein